VAGKKPLETPLSHHRLTTISFEKTIPLVALRRSKRRTLRPFGIFASPAGVLVFKKKRKKRKKLSFPFLSPSQLPHSRTYFLNNLSLFLEREAAMADSIGSRENLIDK